MALILLIDDDRGVRMAVHALLERRGMTVLAAADGAAGIRYFETCAIDLVIVDIFMPDKDGLEVIRTLSRRSPRVPIIAMSGALSRDRYGVAAPDFLGMAGRLGAACCLRKPFRPHQLMAAIETCLGPLPAKQPHDAGLTTIGQCIDATSGRDLRVAG